MNRFLWVLVSFFCFVGVSSQAQQVQKMTLEEIETLFLKQNLQLIAAHYNIDIADAAITQAKLWENPSFSIGQVNFWSTPSQREGEAEVIPPLFGNFARNTEFSLELSQMIQIAGQRRKLMKMEKVSKEMIIGEFEDVLRGLKTELRKSVSEIVYLQEYRIILLSQQQILNQLVSTYRQQVSQGNVGKNELLRLHSSLLDIENELHEIQMEYNEQQKVLKTLLNLGPMTVVEIDDVKIQYKDPQDISLENMLVFATESRPDLKRLQLQTQYYEKSIAYEKSQRAPNLELSVSYDRYGGVWKNFVGFGVSIDLPVLNQNQGNIRIAEYSKEQNHHLVLQQQNIVQQEVVEAFNNYISTYNLYMNMEKDDLLLEIDYMLDTYTQNLLQRNISMLEYIDFMDAYKTNKQTVLSIQKRVNQQFEELQYALGNELK